MKIEIAHKELESSCLNADLVRYEQLSVNGVCTWHLANPSGKIEILFHPFKIQPLLRVNDFLVDYWLAQVYQEDHRIIFDITNFFHNYKNRDRQGRLDSLTPMQKNTDHYLDKYIGLDNLYPDLISEIQEKIK